MIADPYKKFTTGGIRAIKDSSADGAAGTGFRELPQPLLTLRSLSSRAPNGGKKEISADRRPRFRVRSIGFVICLCAGAVFPLASTAQDASPTRLTQPDIVFYLKVLNAAVERVQHPTAGDREDEERSKRAQARQRAAYSEFAASHRDGSQPTRDEIVALHEADPQAADTAAIARASEWQLRPDVLVLREKHWDAGRYFRLKKIIDPLVAESDPGESRDDEARDSAHGTSDREPTRSPAQLGAERVRLENAALLRPYASAIGKRMRVLSRGRAVDDD